MIQEQVTLTNYHKQNNQLHIGRGKSKEKRGLNESGLANSFDSAMQQVKEKEEALRRAQEDREDLNDIPKLSQNSSINLKDLPLSHSDEDLKYFDDEVIKKQAELDIAQERLRHFEAIKHLKEMLLHQESYLKQNQNELQKAVNKRDRVEELDDEDLLDLAEKKVKLAQEDVKEMKLQIEGIRLILPIFESGMLDKESWERIGDVIRTKPEILSTGVDDILIRFRERSLISQKRDIKELFSLRAERAKGNLDAKEKQELNFEIRTIEISLSKYGVDVRDEDTLKAVIAETKPDDNQNDNIDLPESVDPDIEATEEDNSKLTTELVQETINPIDTEGDDEAESVETEDEKFFREFRENVNKLISDSTELLDKIKQSYTVELCDEFDDLVELYDKLEKDLDKRQNLPEFDEFDRLLVEADELLDEIDKLVPEDEGDDDSEQEDGIIDEDEPEDDTPTEEADNNESDIPASPEVSPPESPLNRIFGKVRRVFTGDFWSQAGGWISNKTRGLRNAFNEDSLLVNRNNADAENTQSDPPEEEEVSMYDQIDNLLTELDKAFEDGTDDSKIQDLINQIQKMIDQNQADLGNDVAEKLQKRLDELSGKEDEEDHSEVDGGSLPKKIDDQYLDFEL
ncbi:MAG: hypothetical protein GW942_00415 [Candidatus Pacebacteria bacterium]|nr:hypothetical protein [Candidatus Paceibacterota bacterium]